MKIDANGDVERTLYNLYDAIVGDDADPGRGGALAEVAAELNITTAGNGNDATNDLAGAKINLVSHDGTSVDYILTDSANAGNICL